MSLRVSGVCTWVSSCVPLESSLVFHFQYLLHSFLSLNYSASIIFLPQFYQSAMLIAVFLCFFPVGIASETRLFLSLFIYIRTIFWHIIDPDHLDSASTIKIYIVFILFRILFILLFRITCSNGIIWQNFKKGEYLYLWVSEIADAV